MDRRSPRLQPQADIASVSHDVILCCHQGSATIPSRLKGIKIMADERGVVLQGSSSSVSISLYLHVAKVVVHLDATRHTPHARILPMTNIWLFWLPRR